jgi:hypothetical protein
MPKHGRLRAHSRRPREEFYAKAELHFDTSGKPLAETYLELRTAHLPQVALAADGSKRPSGVAVKCSYCLTLWVYVHYCALSLW